MDILGKYLDLLTGEVVGYRYQNGDFIVCVSEDKAIELGLEDADILDLLDVPVIPCYRYMNSLYIDGTEVIDMLAKYGGTNNIEERRHILEEDCMLDYNGIYDDDSSKVLLLGKLFNKHTCIDINDEVAIQRFLQKDDSI